MEKEINIVEILKDKPKGTKLYSSACGECKLEEVDDKSFKISFYSSKSGFMNGGEGTFDKNGNLYDDGECIVFPSKEMRDWSKFAWKKGDVLVSNEGVHIIFEKFENDTYTRFKGKHYLWKEGNEEDYAKEETYMLTSVFEKVNDDVAECYINTIEERLGGKLNRETLEVEANVNVGDVISDDVLYGICTKVGNSKVFCDFGCDSANYNAPITKLCLQKENINVVMPANKEAWYKEIEKIHHISIDRNTLEVRTEFKDGDIVCISGMGYLAYGIVKSIDNSSKKLEYYVLNDMNTLKFEDWLSFEDKQIQPIAETQQTILFEALAKEGKAWDAEKKQIVDLKPKVEFEPFDRVITRDADGDIWTANIFSHINSHGDYVTIGCAYGYTYCLPYNGKTAKLIGTTKDVEG